MRTNGGMVREQMTNIIKQFIKFGIIGISNTLVTLAIYYLFLWIDPRLYLLGNIAGWVVSVANAFFWNNKFVFKNATRDRKVLLKRIGKTYLTYGSTFILSTVLLFIEVELLHFPAVYSPILNLLITIPLNFLLNKFWAFRN